MVRFLKWALALIVVAIVGLTIAYWTPDTDKAAMRAKYGGPPSQFVDLGGGLTVHLRDEGPREGPAIVLLHGSNADLHTWDPWTARLTAAGYRVVRFDQIGHGLTGPSPTRDYSMAAFTGDVSRVADKLGITTFVLAGNSMGGGIAGLYAIAHPDRLRGLVLVDASGAPVDNKQSLPIGFRIARTPGARDLMLHITPRSVIESSLHQTVSNQSIVNDAMIDRYWEMLRYPGNRQATLDRFTAARTSTDETEVRRIGTPTLILWGAEDKLLPVSGADWFATRIPGSTKDVYPGVGHIPMEEVAQKSADDVIAWLAKLPPVK
jgi:pimeloyl-ACP methyl ester carboxylesterase